MNSVRAAPRAPRAGEARCSRCGHGASLMARCGEMCVAAVSARCTPGRVPRGTMPVCGIGFSPVLRGLGAALTTRADMPAKRDLCVSSPRAARAMCAHSLKWPLRTYMQQQRSRFRSALTTPQGCNPHKEHHQVHAPNAQSESKCL